MAAGNPPTVTVAVFAMMMPGQPTLPNGHGWQHGARVFYYKGAVIVRHRRAAGTTHLSRTRSGKPASGI